MSSEQELNKLVAQFLKEDQEQFSSETFDSTRFLVSILIDPSKKSQLEEMFNTFIEKENECENLITQIINLKHEQFNKLMSKPDYYGEQYEKVRSVTSQSRRMILKSKEYLEKKKIDMNTYYMNQIYVKKVNEALEMVESYQHLIVMIDNFIKAESFYEACTHFQEARNILYSFDDQQRQTILIKQMKEQDKQKDEEIYKILKRQLSYYSFYYNEPLLINDHDDDVKTKQSFALERLSIIQLDITTTFQNSKEFEIFLKDNFNIDLSKYKSFQNKMNQIIEILDEKIYDLDNDYEQFFGQLNHENLMNYLRDFCMKFDDFDRMAQVWDEIGDDLDLLVPSCQKSDLINLMMLLHSSKIVQKTSILLEEYYTHLTEDINTCFWLLKLFFLSKQIDLKKAHFKFTNTGIEYFQKCNFIDPFNIETFHQFTKLIICFSAIIIRKQVLLRKAIRKLDLETESNVRSVSHILVVLISQIEMCLHTFLIRPFDQHTNEYNNESTHLNLLVQEQIKDAVNPSMINLPFLIGMIRDSFNVIIEKLVEVISKDQMKDEGDIQDFELNQKSVIESWLQADLKKFYQFSFQFYKDSICQIFGYDAKNMSGKVNPEYLTIETAQIYNQQNESVQRSSKLYDIVIQKMLVKHEQSLISLYTSSKFLFPQIPICLKNIKQWYSLYKISPTKLEFSEAINVINYQLHIVIQQSNQKLNQLFSGTYVDTFLKTHQQLIFSNPGYIKWMTIKFQKLKLTPSNLGDITSMRDYEVMLKKMYLKYFLKDDVQIDEDFLFNKQYSVSYVATLLVTLELYINQINKFFEDFLDREYLEKLKDQMQHQYQESQIQQAAGSQVQGALQFQQLMQKIRFFQDYNDKLNINVDAYADLDIFQTPINQELLAVSIPRLIKNFKQLLQIASKCYFAIKLELHLKFFAYIFKTQKNMNAIQRAKEFSANNMQDYYQELYRYYSTISQILPPETLDLLFDDYVYMLKKSLKYNYISDKQFKFQNTKTLIKDIKILENELLKIPQIQKNNKNLVDSILKLKHFLSLNMVEENDLVEYLKQNTYKYQFKHIQKYFSMRPSTDKEVIQKRQALVEEAKKYLLQKQGDQTPTEKK
ncbi:hypothetical protein ABPG74_011282 [Tetrahymena malaccensis]